MPCVYKFGGRTLTEEEFKDAVARDLPLDEAARLFPEIQTVPDMPMSKNWQEMALRRMIRYAAENGYDGISWTGGAEQAERYDLSKRISKVTYAPVDGSLRAYDLGGNQVISEIAGPNELPDYIGKEAAEKLLQAPAVNPDTMKAGDKTTVDHYGEEAVVTLNPERRLNEGKPNESIMVTSTDGRENSWYVELRNLARHKLSGVDLKVGGEGMHGFYDKIVPDYLNKFGKKFGAKVENTKVEIPDETLDWRYVGPPIDLARLKEIRHDEDMTSWSIREDARKALNEIDHGVDNETAIAHSSPQLAALLGGKLEAPPTPRKAVPYLPITPAMRESVLKEGVSLFDLGKWFGRKPAAPAPAQGPADPKRQRADILLRETLKGAEEHAEAKGRNAAAMNQAQAEMTVLDQEWVDLLSAKLGGSMSAPALRTLDRRMDELAARRKALLAQMEQMHRETKEIERRDPHVGEVRVDGQGNPTVWLNRTAMGMVKRAIYPDDNDPDILLKGSDWSVAETRWVRNRLATQAPVDGDEERVGRPLMRLLDAALANARKGGVTLVGKTGLGVQSAIGTMREELLHRWQRSRMEDGLPQTHLPEKEFAELFLHMPQGVIDHLREMGYRERGAAGKEMFVIEAAAKIMAGKGRRMGLSEAEGRAWLERYYDKVSQQHGKAAIAEIRHTRGFAREMQKEWEQKNEADDRGAGAGSDRRPGADDGRVVSGSPAGRQGGGKPVDDAGGRKEDDSEPGRPDRGLSGERGQRDAGGADATHGRADGGERSRAGVERAPLEVAGADRLKTDTPEFKAWFGKSKVVDESGAPRVVYHGTRASEDFSEFAVDGPPSGDDDEESPITGSDATAFMGAHFAQEPHVANKFAAGSDWMKSRYWGEGEKPRVMPVYLSIENPKIFASEQELRDFIYDGKISDDYLLEEAMQSDGIDPIEDEDKAEEWDKRYNDDPEFRRITNDSILSRFPEGLESSVRDAHAELGQEARSILETWGHDGVRYKNEVEGGTSWIAFEPTQIKSAIGNAGTYDPDSANILKDMEKQTRKRLKGNAVRSAHEETNGKVSDAQKAGPGDGKGAQGIDAADPGGADESGPRETVLQLERRGAMHGELGKLRKTGAGRQAQEGDGGAGAANTGSDGDRGQGEKGLQLADRNKAFDAVADAQRGDAENAMLKAQYGAGGGVWPDALEHVGDLLHRMTEHTSQRSGLHGESQFGYGNVKDKVERKLWQMQRDSSYMPFEQEFQNNLRNNFESRQKDGKYPAGMTLDDFKQKVYGLGEKYAQEHEKLPVYNRMQWVARQAAIDLGRRKFKETERWLEELKENLDKGKEHWQKVAGEYEPDYSEGRPPQLADLENLKKEAAARKPVRPYNREAYKTPEREYSAKHWTPEETDEEARERRRLRQEWEQSALAALSRGELTPEEAEERGIHTSPGPDKFKPLPPKLFHVTTAADAVEADGIKPRWEMQMQGAVGLGGGSDYAISFTTDLKLARDIEKGIHTARKVAAGEITVQDMVDMVQRGEGAPRPFMDEFEKALQAVIGGDKPLEAALQEEVVEQSMFGKPPERGAGWEIDPDGYHWTGGDGVERYLRWKRPMTEKEKAESRWRIFKAFSPAREWAGGQTDPLFIFNDPDALGRIDPRQIALLFYAPEKGAMGTYESGMTEWRVYSGHAVKLVDRIDREDGEKPQ